MSNKAPLTPGGMLMRKSRLFSMPRPLKPPPTEARSPTATTGFPTHMAVTTTPQARRQCDWGFKYPLPTRTTRHTSTPLVRVRMLDAPESVTDFRSAADHALTLEKFQELNLSMVLPGDKVRTMWWTSEKGSPLSVFEDSHDFTDMDADRRQNPRQVHSYRADDTEAVGGRYSQASNGYDKGESEGESQGESERLAQEKSDAEESETTQQSMEATTESSSDDASGSSDLTLSDDKLSSSSAAASAAAVEEASIPESDPSTENEHPTSFETPDGDSDFWARDPGRARVSSSSADRRWKFRGPWLAGFTDGEFQAYMDRAVRSHSGRVRFRNFLRARMAEKLNEEAYRVAQRKGRQPKRWEILQPGQVSEEQLVEYLRYLRHDLPLMYEVVTSFLDLAPMKPNHDTRELLPSRIQWSNSPWAERGPPPVHPSAGISYLRSNNFIEMHPLYGPQASHAAIESRVLSPGTARGTARIGIGGIVTEPSPDMKNMHSGMDGSFYRLDRDVQGGSKIWMAPTVATVSPTGLVNIIPLKARQQTILVARERRGEDISHELGESLEEMTGRNRGSGRNSGGDYNYSNRPLTRKYSGRGTSGSYGQESWRS